MATTEQNQMLSAILIWIEGNTGVKYLTKAPIQVKDDESGNVSVTHRTSENPVRKNGQFSMAVRETSLVINYQVEPGTDFVIANKNDMATASVRFVMHMVDGTEQSFTHNFDFLGGYLYRVW